MTQVIAKAELHTNPGRQMMATGKFDELGNVIVRTATVIRNPGDVFEWEDGEVELQLMVDCGALVVATPQALADAEYEAERRRRKDQ